MNEPTFGVTPRCCSQSRYSRRVVHAAGYLMSACCSTSSCFMAGESGPIDSPSPKISVVTPCFVSESPRPAAMSDSWAWRMMLMKPGATARPCTSSSCRPRPCTSPSAAIRSPRIARSLGTAGLPLPSYRVAWRRTRSYSVFDVDVEAQPASKSREIARRFRMRAKYAAVVLALANLPAMAAVDLAILSPTQSTPPPRFEPGRSATIRFFTNNYGDEAVNAIATVPLPAGSTLASFSNDWMCAQNGAGDAVCSHAFRPHDGSVLDITFNTPADVGGQRFVSHPRIESLAPDANPNDNETRLTLVVYRTFDVTTDDDFGIGSLRDAITSANGQCGGTLPCKIRFAAPITVEPRTPLPEVTTCDLVIDGGVDAEAGFDVPRSVELSGAKAIVWANGLVLGPQCNGGGPVVVRGLTINRFPLNGIVIEAGPANASGVVVERCFIGTDTTVGEARPNLWRGIAVQSHASSVTIDWNVISGNRYSGVAVWDAKSIQIHSNRIGVGNGLQPIGNGASGVFINGGTLDSYSDIIAYNHDFGIAVGAGALHATWGPAGLHDNGIQNADWYLDGHTPADDTGRMPPVPQLLDARYDAAANHTSVQATIPGTGRKAGFLYQVDLFAVVPGASKVKLQGGGFVNGAGESALITMDVQGDLRGQTIVAVTSESDGRVLYNDDTSEESLPLTIPPP